jgi:hypothetical protein
VVRLVRLEHFAAEYPDFDADYSVGRSCFGQAVVDIGTKCVQRHAAFSIPFRARDLRAVQPARNLDFYAFGTDSHRICHCSAHGPSKLDAALQLLRDSFRDELSIELRLADLGDVDAHILQEHAHKGGNFSSKLFNILALLANNDARPRRVNCNVGALGRSLDVDETYGRIFELAPQKFTHLVILCNVAGIGLRIRIPSGIPLFCDSQSDPDWMNFLTHGY